MQFSKLYTLAIVFLVTALCSVSCSNQSADGKAFNAENKVAEKLAENRENTALNDNPAELASMILLPFVPEETAFQETSDTANPNIKKLTVVLKFSPEDAKNLISQAEKHRAPESVEIGAEGWFPDELTAQAQLSGDQTLKGTAYGANDFIQMPYKTGKLIKIENSDYFILEFSTN